MTIMDGPDDDLDVDPPVEQDDLEEMNRNEANDYLHEDDYNLGDEQYEEEADAAEQEESNKMENEE